MTDPRASGVERVAPDTVPGFRLERLEVLNWGAFARCVGTLELDGRSGLLTGDIGAGTSSLVDALTTLLVPARQVGHVPGCDATERNEAAGAAAAAAVSLRDANPYSVILGVFRNECCDQTVTLAQVFWMKAPQSDPARFFVGAERALSIAEHFTQFGNEIARLRSRLRDLACDIEDSHSGYDAWFRRRFGIGNEQALALVLPSVSTTSVGSLTDFVRNHLLEPLDVAPRIQALIDHFEVLNGAHEAVLRAKRQVELLTPLVDDGDRYAALGREIEALRDCREGLRAYFARIRLGLIDDRLARVGNVLEQLNVQIRRLEARRDDRRNQVDALRRAVTDNGGDGIERLGAEIRKLEGLRDTRRLKAERHGALVKRIGEAPVGDESAFIAQRMRLKALRNEARERDALLENELTEHHVALRQARSEHDLLRDEVESLRRRCSNIDTRSVQMRAVMCEALGIAEAQMPFAGELLQVREEARDWEGAAERLLRGFGLSLLVPDAHYPAVAGWVERSRLHARLTYFHVRPVCRGEPPELHRDSLVHKLSIKPDSPFHEWMAREIAHRFDVACCATQAQFRQEARALTPAGQIKDPDGRHEIDDRHGIDDRGRYVLGWHNAAKIAALQSRLTLLEDRMRGIAERIARVQDQRKLIGERLDALVRLEEFVEFEDLDWASIARAIEALSDERRRLETGSDVLQQLDLRRAQAAQALAATEKELDVARDRRSRVQQRRADANEMRRLAQTAIEQAAARAGLPAPEALAQRLAQAHAAALGAAGAPPSIDACDHHEQETRAHLQRRIDADEAQRERLRARIVEAMTAFKAAFEPETAAFDAGIGAVGAYRGLLERLRGEDLPRLEARFETLLEVETSNAIGNFVAQRASERDAIRERIARINASLATLDDEPGRCIVLEAQPSADAEIRDFLAGLRACTGAGGAGAGDAPRAAAKFLQMKDIVDRFRGRDGRSEQDRRWTAKVTDARNAFLFAVRERRRADDAVQAYDVGPAGASGARTEKLVYTLLAASLACRFGLESGEARSSSLRFVLVDAAFDRGSDESVQHGLRLFRQLDLQILIVTPPQKIQVVAPYVATVGVVRRADGRGSTLRNLTIEAYRAHERARH